jgi:outer membrane protein OmpA-like peptidoglycan-associated protein
VKPFSLLLGSALVASAFALSGAGCAGGPGECHPNTWSGTCKLVQVTKIRESEFPLPNVVLEGVYRPQSEATGATLVPPDARREFGALTKFEEALRAHLDAHPEVRCYVNPPPPGQCQPGPMVVEVPEFDAAHAQAASQDLGPKGCAQIESSASQDKITQNSGPTSVVTQRFEFAENSAELSASAGADLDALAARIKQAPNMQCLGVVGAWVRGETVAVAFARARAVREQLIQRGIEPERLVALTVDPNMVGTSGVPEPVNAKDRRVSLSVLLELAPSP